MRSRSVIERSQTWQGKTEEVFQQPISWGFCPWRWKKYHSNDDWLSCLFKILARSVGKKIQSSLSSYSRSPFHSQQTKVISSIFEWYIFYNEKENLENSCSCTVLNILLYGQQVVKHLNMLFVESVLTCVIMRFYPPSIVVLLIKKWKMQVPSLQPILFLI